MRAHATKGSEWTISIVKTCGDGPGRVAQRRCAKRELLSFTPHVAYKAARAACAY
jgi:hypothetical protein